MAKTDYKRVRSSNCYVARADYEPVYFNRNASGVAYKVTGTIVKSYDTIVAVVCPDAIYLTPYWDCSRTTTKHVMEWVRHVVSATPRDIRKAICDGSAIDDIPVEVIHVNKRGELYV